VEEGTDMLSGIGTVDGAPVRPAEDVRTGMGRCVVAVRDVVATG